MNLIMPVYIVNEDILRLTKEAVASFGEVKLIIIDNASPLGGGYLRSIADIYVRNPVNLGYAKAVNQGLRLSVDAEFIAIANNDIRVSPNWQEVARSVLLGNSLAYSCHFRMTDYEVPFAYGDEVAYTGKERWCTSSFFVIRNNRSINYYDENFFNSYDDWEYWYRVRLNGRRTAYTNKACYQHQHSSTQSLVSEREIQNNKNKEYFKSKWGDYAEDLFERQFPEQMKQDYWEGFSI